jgi:hypothetical protein
LHELRRILRTTAAVCVLVTAAPPTLAEPTVESTDEREARLLERLAREEALQGAASATLIEPLLDLSEVYEERALGPKAIAALEKARQVVRMNYGLFSMEEVAVLRQQIRIERSMGDVPAAWDLEQRLIGIVNEHPTDLRTAPILTEIADERMNILDRYVAGKLPPEIRLGCYYKGPPPSDSMIDTLVYAQAACTSGNRSDVIAALTAEAWSHYAKAIDVLVANRAYARNELKDLEWKLIRSAYERRAFGSGRQRLNRLVAYDVATGAPLVARVESVLRVTDWDLLAAHANGILLRCADELKTYREANAELDSEQVEQAAIDALFAPKIPIVLPTFLANPLASGKTPESRGHIDVTFEVTECGRSKHVAVLDAENATRAERRALVRVIQHSSFRPRAVDGRITDLAPVVLRYYLN